MGPRSNSCIAFSTAPPFYLAFTVFKLTGSLSNNPIQPILYINYTLFLFNILVNTNLDSKIDVADDFIWYQNYSTN